MPGPHTGERAPGYDTFPLWTFDSQGNLVLTGGISTFGFPGTVTPGAVTAQPGRSAAANYLTGLLPSGDTSGVKDVANINGLKGIAGNTEIKLSRGTFYLSTPLIIDQNGIQITGGGGPGISTDDNSLKLGTVLTLTSTFTNPQYGAFATAGILMMDQGPGAAGNPTRGARVRDLWVDCTSATGTVDGIAAYGAVQAVELRNVGVINCSGNGVNWIKDTGAAFAQPFPDGWTCVEVTIQNPAGYGYTGKVDDSAFIGCRSHLQGLDGWNVTGLNCYFVACRGDNGAGYGFTTDAQPPGGSSVGSPNTFVGCGTQANALGGFHVNNTSALGTTQRAPVIICGCMFAGDGTTGAGTEAGILVSGRNTVFITGGTVVAVGNNVDPSNCPAYAVATATVGASGNPLSVIWDSGFANYQTAVFNDAAGIGAKLYISPSVLTGQGLQPTTVTRFAAALTAGSLTISGAFTTSGSMMSLTNTATTASSPILYIAAAAADAVAGVEVTGDTNQRFKFDCNGKHSWGPGNAGSDCFMSRQAAGIMQFTSCSLDVATGGQGLQVSENGTGPKQGTATLTAGTVVVSNTNVTANSRIFLTPQDNNTTGALRVSARTAGTSFTITSSNAGDTGKVAYEIFEQG